VIVGSIVAVVTLAADWLEGSNVQLKFTCAYMLDTALGFAARLAMRTLADYAEGEKHVAPHVSTVNTSINATKRVSSITVIHESLASQCQFSCLRYHDKQYVGPFPSVGLV
jgi:hypothetical protein